MRLRKLLLATGAIATVSAMALAPAAQAIPGTPISNVSVGGSSVNTSHPINLTMVSGSLTTSYYGFPSTALCSSGGTAGGVVNGGTSGIPTYELVLTSMNLTCSAFFPGITLSLTATCNIRADFNDLVHAGLVNTGAVAANDHHRVAGTMLSYNGLSDCVAGRISNGCTFNLTGSSTAFFDEAVKTVSGVDYQELTLTGSTLTMRRPFGCYGAFIDNQSFAINAVFDVQSPDGLIDFQ